MDITECAICYDPITRETGIVKMACNHSFHFCCLGGWFSTQFVNKQKETCPCCRYEASEKESLPKRAEDALNRSFEDLRWDEEDPLIIQNSIQNLINQVTRDSNSIMDQNAETQLITRAIRGMIDSIARHDTITPQMYTVINNGVGNIDRILDSIAQDTSNMVYTTDLDTMDHFEDHFEEHIRDDTTTG